MILMQGDCLERMSEIESGSVDLVLADLPYGTTNAPWDKVIPFAPMWEQVLRVTKHNAAMVFFSQLPFGSDLIQSQRKLFRYEWIWEKPTGVGFLNAKKMPLRKHENLLVFYQKLPTYNPQFSQGKPYSKNLHRITPSEIYQNIEGHCMVSDGRRYPQSVLVYNGVNNTFTNSKLRKRNTCHSTQKPVEVLEYLIKTYTNEGEVVLDFCMGSGSTGVACVKQGREFIGIEKEEKYYEIACRRIEEATAEKGMEIFS